MEPQSARPRTAAISQTAIAMAGLLLACALAPAASLAATESGDRIANELRSLDIPAEKLALEIVEHMVINDRGDFDALPGDADLDAPAQNVTPILLLTPRVASILREVFGSAVQNGDEVPSQQASDNEAKTTAGNSVSAVADGGGRTIQESPGPALGGEVNGNQYMPRFQRQMYRTDI